MRGEERALVGKDGHAEPKPTLHGPVKLEDVALAAGVSPKTASRVINGECYVSKSKREAVEAAVAALGYRPNLQARALASSRSFMVGVFSGFLGGYYFSELHRSAIRAAKAEGLYLLLEEVKLNDPSLPEHLEQMLGQMRFEGIILTPLVCDDERLLDILERQNIRYVRLSPMQHPGRSHAVFMDEVHGMNILAEHFRALGHERIGIVGAEGGMRRVRLIDALIRTGLDPGQFTISNVTFQMSPDEVILQAASDLLNGPEIPTAIFGLNDEVAAGLMRHALAKGLNVPGDVSIAGFDDSDISRAIWPTLTTIRQPLQEIANMAVSLLLEPAGGPFRQMQCPVSLIVRGSTGPAPASKRARRPAAQKS